MDEGHNPAEGRAFSGGIHRRWRLAGQARFSGLGFRGFIGSLAFNLTALRGLFHWDSGIGWGGGILDALAQVAGAEGQSKDQCSKPYYRARRF
jgi:hypothetical protein